MATTTSLSEMSATIARRKGRPKCPLNKCGLVSLWAVVHDARGGVTTLQRFVKVE
jgi:hypothetical protein